MQPVDHEVEWREFKAAFRGHHIRACIMDRKLNEFLALTQGNRIVLQYAQAFNDLCQYAGYHADADEKKRDRFRRGLSTKLRDRLNTVRANSYNKLVNVAISQEDCITAYRRFDPGGSLDRRVNCRRVSQPRWVGARWSTKGGRRQAKGETHGLRVVLHPGRVETGENLSMATSRCV
jgi:hypothetical protein